MKIKIKDKGLAKLMANLESREKNMQSMTTKVVTEYTGQLKDEAHKNAEPGKIFVKGYSQGNIRDNLTDSISTNGYKVTGEVGTTMHYAPYVEYGTRFMEAEPFMKPAVDKVEEKFIKACEAMVK